MGYSLQPDLVSRNRGPASSFRTPKTLTPGPRLQQRGRRYYSPELGRWLNRDPIAEVGSISWVQRQEARRKLLQDLGMFGGAGTKEMGRLIEALLEARGPSAYAFCVNNAISVYDLLGELNCFVKAAQMVALEAQMVYQVWVIDGLAVIHTASVMAALEAYLAMEMNGAALLSAILAEKICLANHCPELCLPLTLEVAQLREVMATLMKAYDVATDTMITAATALGQAVSDLADLARDLRDLGSTPCTWF